MGFHEVLSLTTRSRVSLIFYCYASNVLLCVTLWSIKAETCWPMKALTECTHDVQHTLIREGSEEIRQAEGIKIELKKGFVFLPPHEPGLLLITKLSGPC